MLGLNILIIIIIIRKWIHQTLSWCSWIL